MSKRTLFLIFALFIITSVLLIMALYKPNIQPSIQITPAPKEEIAQTILLFGQPIATSSSSTIFSYSLPIQITTGKNKVNAVQLEMQYDHQVLSNVSVAPGVFFKNPEILLNQIDAKTGRITYAFGVGLKDQGIVGQGTVATLTFSAKKTTAQETTIIFLPKTLVTAEGITASVLKQTSNIQIILGEKTSTPSAQ